MKVAALVSLASLALATPAPGPEPRKVAYSRRKYEPVLRDNGVVDMDWVLGQVKHTILKYNKEAKLSKRLQDLQPVKRATSGTEVLNDQVSSGEDVEYVGMRVRLYEPQLTRCPGIMAKEPSAPLSRLSHSISTQAVATFLCLDLAAQPATQGPNIVRTVRRVLGRV